MATLSIPISKAGKGAVIDVEFNMDDYNDDQLKMLFTEGLKSILNSRMSKLAAPTKLEGDELELAKTEALEKAAENLADFKSGKLVKRSASKSASTEKKEVLTEALRQCKEVVRDRLKAAGKRISTVAAKDVTAAAKMLLAQRETFYISKAKEALAERKAEDVADVDVLSLVKEDPKKVAKLEAEKAERKTVASAKQAGLTTKRAGKGKSPVPPRKGDTPSHATSH